MGFKSPSLICWCELNILFLNKMAILRRKKLSFAKLSPAGSRSHFLSMEYLVVRFCRANTHANTRTCPSFALTSWPFGQSCFLRFTVVPNFSGGMFFLYRVSFRGSFATLSSKHTSISADLSQKKSVFLAAVVFPYCIFILLNGLFLDSIFLRFYLSFIGSLRFCWGVLWLFLFDCWGGVVQLILQEKSYIYIIYIYIYTNQLENRSFLWGELVIFFLRVMKVPRLESFKVVEIGTRTCTMGESQEFERETQQQATIWNINKICICIWQELPLQGLLLLGFSKGFPSGGPFLQTLRRPFNTTQHRKQNQKNPKESNINQRNLTKQNQTTPTKNKHGNQTKTKHCPT